MIRRLQPELAEVDGIRLYHAAGAGPDGRGPRQPHAVPVQPGGRRPAELRRWAPKLLEALRARPELRDVGTRPAGRGLQAAVTIDRATASRLGITPQLIDDTLYDAFGQRQISTMFTQLNQYRVVLEVAPEMRHAPTGLDDIYLGGPGGGRAARAVTRVTETTAPLVDQPPGAVSRR